MAGFVQGHCQWCKRIILVEDATIEDYCSDQCEENDLRESQTDYHLKEED